MSVIRKVLIARRMAEEAQHISTSAKAILKKHYTSHERDYEEDGRTRKRKGTDDLATTVRSFFKQGQYRGKDQKLRKHK